MAIEPQAEIPDSEEGPTGGSEECGPAPVELSEFSQRLASFGLGESPNPLLTEAHPPAKRRSQS
jgi:hypothetical protein